MAIQWGGQTWGPGELEAFKSWLSKRGKSYSGWAGKHPGAAAGTFGLSGGPYDALASARADAQLAPIRASIESERKQNAKTGQSLQENNAGMYEALASILKGIGPMTKQTYADAANSTAAFGKGFADEQGATQDADKAALAEHLRTIGAPEEQIAQATAKVGGSDATDVTYGLGGYIPASSLAREGAAFTAASEQLPGYAAGLGMENARAIQGKVLEQDKSYADELKNLALKYPELRTQALNDILGGNRAQEALDIQRKYLGNTQFKTGADVTGYYTGPDGNLYPTADTTAAEAKAAADAKKAAGKNAKSTNVAAGKREGAFDSARKSMFADVEGMVSKIDPTDLKVGIATLPDYASTKKALFNKYKYLLRYATKSGQAKLKKRLNQMLDEALSAQGIKPSAAPKRAKPRKANPKNGIGGAVGAGLR